MMNIYLYKALEKLEFNIKDLISEVSNDSSAQKITELNKT